MEQETSDSFFADSFVANEGQFFFAKRSRLTQMLDVKPLVENDNSLDEAEEKLKQMRQDDDSDLSRRREEQRI